MKLFTLVVPKLHPAVVRCPHVRMLILECLSGFAPGVKGTEDDIDDDDDGEADDDARRRRQTSTTTTATHVPDDDDTEDDDGDKDDEDDDNDAAVADASKDDDEYDSEGKPVGAEDGGGGKNERRQWRRRHPEAHDHLEGGPRGRRRLRVELFQLWPEQPWRRHRLLFSFFLIFLAPFVNALHLPT